MKAVVCDEWGEPEGLVLREIDDPVPGAGELVVDVAAAAANFPDVLILRRQYQAQPTLPFVPGRELAGVVTALGPDVTGFAIGMRIFATVENGAFAEKARVKAANAMVLPDGVDDATAAAFTLTYGTSYHGLVDRAALRAGESVLVLGAAGGVGIAAIEIAKAVGARVLAAVSSSAKAAVCLEHGADAVVDYAREDLRAAMAAFTGGRGIDVIYDPVGGEFSEQAFRSIAWGGRHLVVGFANGEVPRLRLNLPLLKGASLVGVFWGEFTRREHDRYLEGMGQLVAWLASGRLRPHISQRLPLSGAAKALRLLADRQAVGKLIVCPRAAELDAES